MCVGLFPLLTVLIATLQVSHAQTPQRVPHVDECNYCSRCIVDTAVSAVQYTPPAVSLDTKGQQLAASLLQPLDVEQKALLPNCSVCRGCNMQLWDISSKEVRFKNVQFLHGKGATNSRIFFAQLLGSEQRFVLKVFCVPISKVRHSKKVVTCSVKMASERVEILMAQQKLLKDCAMQEISPQLWLVNISAIVPDTGYHVHWHGLMMEEAKGITLHALYLSRENRLALQLLGQQLNKTQVQLGALWDLLTSQCDRHAENIFIGLDGNLQYIDNDKALGVVSRCGFDSMLLPGTRYHSVLRIGFWSQLADYYRTQRLGNPNFCRGTIDPRFVMDYRCTTESGEIGTAYPPGFERCLRKLSALSVDDVMLEYGLSSAARADTLRTRASDMLARGFEWTMENGAPPSSRRYKLPKQPACCGLAVMNRMIVCDKCWQPLLPEDFSNSTDLALVTSLLDAGAQASHSTRFRYRQHVQLTTLVGPTGQ